MQKVLNLQGTSILMAFLLVFNFILQPVSGKDNMEEALNKKLEAHNKKLEEQLSESSYAVDKGVAAIFNAVDLTQKTSKDGIEPRGDKKSL